MFSLGRGLEREVVWTFTGGRSGGGDCGGGEGEENVRAR